MKKPYDYTPTNETMLLIAFAAIVAFVGAFFGALVGAIWRLA